MTVFSDEPGDGVLARAAALLDAFDDEHRELTLAALVGRSGLPRSTAHRMAAQMVALGWLDKPGGRYRIGNRLFALSGLAPVRHTLREAVLPFLQDLYEATRTTVQLGVLDGDRVLIVEKITGHRRMPMLTQVGGQIPAYCSSLGRVILAHSDPRSTPYWRASCPPAPRARWSTPTRSARRSPRCANGATRSTTRRATRA